MAKLNKKLFLNGWILLALILVVGVAGSLYSIPYIEGYKNKNDFLIFAPNILNTPWGEIIRHNWSKNDDMHRDLDHLITNEIDINYNGKFDLNAHIE